jgi:hypothetical protein
MRVHVVALVTMGKAVHGIVVLLRGGRMGCTRGGRGRAAARVETDGVETVERPKEEADGEAEPEWVGRMAMGVETGGIQLLATRGWARRRDRQAGADATL